MLDVRKMHLLRELARLGTIAAVAQAEFCTPSAVSQQLSALERDTGVELIRRSGRGVELTAAGADLADRTGPVLALLEEAAAALAVSRTELAGELRIGAFQTAVRTLLPAALVTLGAEHPGLELRVTELDPAQAPDALRAGVLDIALVHEYDCVPAEPDPGLRTKPLLEETIFLASAAGEQGEMAAAEPCPGDKAVLATGEQGELAELRGELAGPRAELAGLRAELAGHRGELALTSGEIAAFQPLLVAREQPWIVASPGTLCHLMAVRLCQGAGFAPRIRHYADDFAAVLSLVAAGQGVALVPELALADRPDGVTLTPVPARRRTLIAFRAAAAAHPAVTACAAAIQAAAASYGAGCLVHRRTSARSAAVHAVVVSR
jgi:DNA-binding transcriptional LysR family regulator